MSEYVYKYAHINQVLHEIFTSGNSVDGVGDLAERREAHGVSEWTCIHVTSEVEGCVLVLVARHTHDVFGSDQLGRSH